MASYLARDASRYRREPGHEGPTWPLTLQAVLDYAGISVDTFADACVETDKHGEPKRVSRSTMYERLAGERPLVSEAQFQVMADALGLPRRVIQTMEPDEAIWWIRQNIEAAHWASEQPEVAVPELPTGPWLAGDSGRTTVRETHFVQNQMGKAA